MIVTVTAWPFFSLVILTVEPKGSDLCAAVMASSLRGMPLAVLAPRCDESPTAYTDATHSSARTGILANKVRARRSIVACVISDLSGAPRRDSNMASQVLL